MSSLSLVAGKKGFALLGMVLVVGIVALLISLSLSLRGSRQVRASLSNQEALQTQALADSCYEDMLRRAPGNNAAFTLTTTAVLGGDCTAAITTQTNNGAVPPAPIIYNPRSITVTARRKNGEYLRKITATVLFLPAPPVVQSWSVEGND